MLLSDLINPTRRNKSMLDQLLKTKIKDRIYNHCPQSPIITITQPQKHDRILFENFIHKPTPLNTLNTIDYLKKTNIFDIKKLSCPNRKPSSLQKQLKMQACKQGFLKKQTNIKRLMAMQAIRQAMKSNHQRQKKCFSAREQKNNKYQFRRLQRKRPMTIWRRKASSREDYLIKQGCSGWVLDKDQQQFNL